MAGPGYLANVASWSAKPGIPLPLDAGTPQVLTCAGGRLVGVDDASVFVMDPAVDDDVVRLDAEELARVESWLAEGDLLRATSLEDESEVAPGPHQRVGITVLIDLDAETHEFSLTGIRLSRVGVSASSRVRSAGHGRGFLTL